MTRTSKMIDYDRIAANIVVRAKKQSMSMEDVGKRIGISRGAMYRRIHDPSALTLLDVANLAVLFRCQIGDILE